MSLKTPVDSARGTANVNRIDLPESIVRDGTRSAIVAGAGVLYYRGT